MSGCVLNSPPAVVKAQVRNNAWFLVTINGTNNEPDDEFLAQVVTVQDDPDDTALSRVWLRPATWFSNDNSYATIKALSGAGTIQVRNDILTQVRQPFTTVPKALWGVNQGQVGNVETGNLRNAILGPTSTVQVGSTFAVSTGLPTQAGQYFITGTTVYLSNSAADGQATLRQYLISGVTIEIGQWVGTVSTPIIEAPSMVSFRRRHADRFATLHQRHRCPDPGFRDWRAWAPWTSWAERGQGRPWQRWSRWNRWNRWK